MNISKEYWLLIQRYVTGNAKPAEVAKLKEWMREHPDRKNLVHEMESIWNIDVIDEFEANAGISWKQFEKRVDQDLLHSRAIDTSRRFPEKRLRSYIYYIAAIILLSLFSGFFAYYYTSNDNSTEQSEAFYIMQDLVTDKGEKARVTFSDGTEVILNSDGVLRFPEKFDRSKREIYLDGEAYFNVAHDPDNPFIVHAQDVETEVLGTEFNIRGRKDETSVDVVVRDGKVSVRSTVSDSQEQSEVILSEGFQSSIKKGEAPSEAVKVDVDSRIMWIKGGVYFENETFEQVCKKLERRFDLEINIEDPEMLNIPLSGTFRHAELNEILTVIAAYLDIKFRRAGSKVTFYS